MESGASVKPGAEVELDVGQDKTGVNFHEWGKYQ